jgi:hypothetical protein
MSNVEKLYRLNSTLWKTKSVDPNLTINEHFGASPTGTSYPRNYVFKSVRVSGFIKENPAAKLHPTCNLMDFLPRFILLNAKRPFS